jgi:proteasome activator subunit 4
MALFMRLLQIIDFSLSILHEKIATGWLAWRNAPSYLAPPPLDSPLLPWADDCQEAVQAIRDVVTKAEYWQKLTKHYSSENHAEVIVQDNASMVKSICTCTRLRSQRKLIAIQVQLLEDEPWEALRPSLDTLLSNNEKNKQRAAAEVIGGIISGSFSYSI